MAIRYPKGNVRIDYSTHMKVELGTWEYLQKKDSKVVILATGATAVSIASHAVEFLNEEKIPVSLVNARFIKPLDTKVLDDIKDKTIITIEDNVISGSFGSACMEYYLKNNIHNVDLHLLGIDDKILKNASQADLLQQNHLDSYYLRDLVKSLQ